MTDIWRDFEDEFDIVERPRVRQREPRLVIRKITDAARDQECTIRHPTYCNGNRETVVACHPNWLDTGHGFCLKPDDFTVVFGCAGCHLWFDTSRDDERRDYYIRAHCRTLRNLWERGIIK